MKRLLVRSVRFVGGYVGPPLAVGVAGFLGGAFGIWASILWGMVLITAIGLLIRHRSHST